MSRYRQHPRKRKPLSPALKREVLIEAGYRCAVPTCRSILAIDLHHIVPVKQGGPNELYNLLALCPTCHALYTRGTISEEAIHAWKMLLVTLNHAFDTETISHLLFLQSTQGKEIWISGDGMLRFTHLIAIGLAEPHLIRKHNPWCFYVIRLTPKGQSLLDAWCSGNRQHVLDALREVPPSH